MSKPLEPNKKELTSTYFVQDRQSQEELVRLTIQGHMLTASMGGVLPEQANPSAFHRVLDIGCGAGDWVIEAAQTYPEMLLVGIDISNRMIDYAREQAKEQHVANRVEFHIMDALRILEFPNACFDLVNLRLGISFMRKWEWPKLLDEFQRVTRRGGIVRVTEADMVECNSPALARREQILQQAFYNAGHLFAPEKDGVTRELVPLLTQHGLRDVQTQEHLLYYSAGTPEGQRFAENMQHGFRTLRPFFQKWTRLPEDYDDFYQQAILEMQQPNFSAVWRYVTVWGKVDTRR